MLSQFDSLSISIAFHQMQSHSDRNLTDTA